jgi:amino acid transporter
LTRETGKPAPAPALRRELGLRDLTLFAVTSILGSRWIAAAAQAGPGSLLLWLLSAVFVVVPLAIAVAALTLKYPGTGGLYLWTSRDFGPWHGFLCFWVYWLGIAFWFPSAAMLYMSVGFYTLGPRYAHMADNRAWVVGVSLVAIWIALGTNLVGLRVGKWTENAGGVAAWALCLVLAAAAVLVWAHRGSATRMSLAPAWNWSTLSFWAAIGYATTGMELVGLMGAEIRDPERTLPRAAWISSAFIIVFYTSATLALLVILPVSKISELYGLAQGGEMAASVLGTPWLAPLIGILVLASAVGQFGGIGTAVSRLPLAAGVDRLVPAAFGRIHPRWATPHVSIVTLGVVSSVLLIATQFGDTLRAAYQAMVSLMLIGGFLPYLYIYASAFRAGRRWSASAGFAMAVFMLLCSVVPGEGVTRVWLFELKLALGTAGMILSAWFLYRRSRP